MNKDTNILTKGEITFYEQFLLLPQCLHNVYAAEASESVYMLERVKITLDKICYIWTIVSLILTFIGKYCGENTGTYQDQSALQHSSITYSLFASSNTSIMKTTDQTSIMGHVWLTLVL